MTVDQKSIDAMANIMQILNGQSAAPADASDDHDDYLPESVGANGVGRAVNMDPGVDAMKTILERMYAASDTTKQATQKDPTLREAMVTEKTTRGARIGVWEIIVNEGAAKSYDVVSMDGNMVIASHLQVYEAAYGIAKRLNEGVAINDPKIRDLLDLEEGFTKRRTEAMGYKERAKKFREKGEDLRAAVAEDRLDEAARYVEKAHEDILRLAGLR